MLSKTIRFSQDRTSILDLQSKEPELFSLMQAKGLISDSSKLHFCGVIISKTGPVFFLPRNSPKVSEIEHGRVASFMLRALCRYTVERETKVLSGEVGDGAQGTERLQVIVSLLDDYAMYGLYTKRRIERGRNIGRVDWKRTIARMPAFHSSSGPMYLDYIGSRKRFVSSCEISRIHASIIRKLDRSFGWLITTSNALLDPSLIDIDRSSGTRSQQIARLRAELHETFSEREMDLIKLLIKYLEQEKSNEDSLQVIGLKEFHGMWEHMLHSCLKYTTPINKELATPVYKINGKFNISPMNRQRTDTVLKSPEGHVYTVVDAKYYAARGIGSVPRWKDLVKQHFYVQALKLIRPDTILNSVFIFPGEDGPIDSIHMGVGNKQSFSDADLLDREYPPIHCFYQNPLELVIAFTKNKKLDRLSENLISLKTISILDLSTSSDSIS